MTGQTDITVPAENQPEMFLEPQMVEGEARIRDLDLAARLGFAKQTKIRELIKRHSESLSALGPLPTVGRVVNGGQATEFYLNRKQAIFITAKSETPAATEITIEIIERFDEYERGSRRAQPVQFARTFRGYMSVARAVGLDRHQAALAANRATKIAVGFGPLDDLGIMLVAPRQEVLLTPSDIGARLGGKSAIAVNQLLAEKGLQTGHRDAKDRSYWEPTSKGLGFAVILDTGKKHSDGTPVRQVKWNAGVIDVLSEVAA